MKAIILISEHTILQNEKSHTVPRSLFRFGTGECLLEQQLYNLHKVEVKEIEILGDLQPEHRKIADQHASEDVSIRLVEKPSGIAYHGWLSEYLRQSKDDSLLVLFDNSLFNAALLEKLIAHEKPCVMVIDKLGALLPGTICVQADMSRLVAISTTQEDVGWFYWLGTMKLDRNALVTWAEALDASDEPEIAMQLKAVLDIHLVNYIIVDNQKKKDWATLPASFKKNARDDIQLTYGSLPCTLQQFQQAEAHLRYYDKAQWIQSRSSSILELFSWLKDRDATMVLVICDNTYEKLPLPYLLKYYGLEHVTLAVDNAVVSRETVAQGIGLLCGTAFDAIVSVGNACAIETGKMVSVRYGDNAVCETREIVPHIAIPSLSGLGTASSSTAVVEEQNSIALVQHPWMLPKAVLLDSNLSFPLSLDQSKYAYVLMAYYALRLIKRHLEDGVVLVKDNDAMSEEERVQVISLRLALAGMNMLLSVAPKFYQEMKSVFGKVLNAFHLIGQAFDLYISLQPDCYQQEKSIDKILDWQMALERLLDELPAFLSRLQGADMELPLMAVKGFNMQEYLSLWHHI